MLRRASLTVLAVFVALAAWQWLTWPDVARLADSDPETSAFIRLHEERNDARAVQTWVPYAAIAADLKHAVLVAEDIDFFNHHGFAVDQMQIALREALKEGRPLRGASTISQQLAKNLWLSPTRNPWRKVKEILLTRQLEHKLTKRRILELYLNFAQFGPDVFGAEAAAQSFFGVPAAGLTARQAAALAAGLSRPSSWNPRSRSEGYRRRVALVTARMRRSAWLLKQL